MNRSIFAFFISKDCNNVLVDKEHPENTALHFRNDTEMKTFLEKFEYSYFILEDNLIRIKAFDTIEIDIRFYLIESETDIDDERYYWIKADPIILADQEYIFKIDTQAFITDSADYIVKSNKRTGSGRSITKEQFCEYLTYHRQGDLRINKPVRNRFLRKNRKDM